MRNKALSTKHIIDLDHIPAASIAGFKLVPRVRSLLLDLPKNVLLSNLHDFVFGKNEISHFVDLAGSDYEFKSLLACYTRFLIASEKGRRQGRVQSTKLAWIIPDILITKNMETDPVVLEAIRELGIDDFFKYDFDLWLPWISLGMVNLLRRWRRPRIRTIHRAMLKLCSNPQKSLPWESSYTEWERHLPMQSLYMHEPIPLLEQTLVSFSELELISINDLRCCHPDAIVASKTKDQPLFTLHRFLKTLVS